MIRVNAMWVADGARTGWTASKRQAQIQPVMWRTIAAVWFATAAAGLVLSQSASPPQPDRLTPRQSLSVVLPPGGDRLLSVSIPPSLIAYLEIEQLQGMVSASVEGATPALQFGSDAGVHSVIKIPVQGAPQGVLRLHLHSRDHYLPVRLSIEMTQPRAARPEDQEAFAAYAAYAEAEAMRRARQAGGNPSALQLYDKAIVLAQKTTDRLLQQQAWIGKSRFFVYDLGDYTQGLACALRATGLIAGSDLTTPGAAMAIAAHAWKNLSSTESFLAHYAQGIAAGNRSLALYQRLGDLYWQGILEGNLANAYLEMGDTTHAQAASQQALAIAQKLQDFNGIAFTMTTLAGIHAMRGEYQAAIDANRAAIAALAKAPDADDIGQIWLNQAEIYGDLGDAEHQRAAIRTGLALLRQAHDAANTSSGLSSLAILDIRQHRLAQAERHLDESLSLARSRQLNRELCMAELGEAELLAARGRGAAALAELKQAIALAEVSKEAETHALLLESEGDLLARTRQQTQALAAYRQAESGWSSMFDTEDASLTLADIARVELRQGRNAAALSDILQALDGFETARRHIGSADLSQSFYAARHDSFDLAIRMLMSPSPTGENSGGNPARAWKIAERARAQTLMDAIRSSTRLSAQPLPAEAMEKRAAIEQAVAQAEKDVFRLGAQARTLNDPSLRQAEVRLRSLVFESDQIAAAGREGASFNPGDLRPPSPAAIEHDLLDGHTALLEYWVGRHGIFRWTFTSSGLTACRLPNSADLLRQMDAFKRLLLAREDHPAGEDLAGREARIAQADREAARVAQRLGRGLLPELAPSIHRLILVPDGPLDSLPFAALRNRKGRWLIQRYELDVEPSAAIALALHQRPANARATQIAVFADPVYSHDDPRFPAPSAAHAVAFKPAEGAPLLRAADSFDAADLPRLPGSEKEAQAILRIAGPDRVRLYLGFQATPQRVMQSSWSRFAILHFATHAIVNLSQPELSGIVLSTVNRQGRPEDGILWLHDIYHTPFPVPLVIIDGCRTAAGRNIPGEGITGFAQAFLASGASGVLGSLWDVDDRAAGRLVPILYHGLIDRKLSVPAALRAAQLKLMADPALHAPYAWAGFVFEGNGRWQGNFQQQ